MVIVSALQEVQGQQTTLLEAPCCQEQRTWLLFPTPSDTTGEPTHIPLLSRPLCRRSGRDANSDVTLQGGLESRG